MPNAAVPKIRLRTLNDAPLRPAGEFVLYWMTSNRRTKWNYALDRAIELARQFKKPLVVLEALRVGYPWASDRLHRFVLQGMADNRRSFAPSPVTYIPYVEPAAAAGKGLLAALAERSVVVVADEFPCFFLPRMQAAAAARMSVSMELVDSNGLLPLRATDQVFPTAYAFRRFLQRSLPTHLTQAPAADPLANLELPTLPSLPNDIVRRWPPTSDELLTGATAALAKLPIDHNVRPACFDGGSRQAEAALSRFLAERLARYADERNQPQKDAASGLSPYLHFGQVSAHEVFDRVARREKWSADKLAKKTSGSREGWWGMSGPAESFLDELVTWRELGYNMCSHRNDYDRYESLPEWAQNTLEKHARDERQQIYSLAEFETSATHDSLWNAAQRQLVAEGRMHNYLRMLWGKKILEWSATPQDALATMIELNNKYAVDGRNPNSYSGIFWVLGRYDRAWGPERKIYGTIRYMSSENTARKVRVAEYVERYGAQIAGGQGTLWPDE